MLEKLGHPVVRLVRTAIGPVRDSQLQPGEWRTLTTQEITGLYADAGATWEDAPAMMSEDR